MDYVFTNKELLYIISEYLPSKYILNFSTIFLGSKYKKYIKGDIIVCEIYAQLYKKLNLNPTSYEYQILIPLTLKILINGKGLQYYYCKTIPFSNSEIEARDIIFSAINISNINITSLYYVLFENGFYSLLNRFIVDGIIVSPYECTHSNRIRHTLNYYGNDQTLRIALRLRQYNMVEKILADMKYISKKIVIHPFFIIWRKNTNVLYELISNHDIEGLAFIFRQMGKCRTNLISLYTMMLLECSDNLANLSNINNLSSEINHRIENNSYIVENEHEIGDDQINRMGANVLLYAIQLENNNLFNDWGWNTYKPINLNDLDVLSIKKDSPAIISERFSMYISLQYDQICHYITQSTENFKMTKILEMELKSKNINIYQIINGADLQYEPSDNQYYLILELFSKEYSNVFMIFFTLIYYFNDCFGEFNVDYLYYQYDHNTFDSPDSSWIHNKLNISYKIIDVVNLLIYHKYYRSIFISDDFEYFINLLLVRKFLTDGAIRRPIVFPYLSNR